MAADRLTVARAPVHQLGPNGVNGIPSENVTRRIPVLKAAI
jgi:hypothetical protein